MKDKIIKTFLEMKSGEYACDTELFQSQENHLLLSEDQESFFKMITFGKGVVVKAKQPVYDDLKEFFVKETGIFCFDAPQLCRLNEKLAAYGFRLDQIYDTFLPFNVGDAEIAYNGNLRIVRLSDHDIEQLENAHTPNEIRGNLIYFHRKHNRENLVLGGSELPETYDYVMSWPCCGGGYYIQVNSDGQIIDFFASKGDAWYHVQAGYFELP